ncbi:glycosyltransferase family 2 protein [Massilia sp. GCM10020059]|uniref:glycosyltransferase family 2 protein n=1 Tax=Massilia TaxID=149698 RepID=UPI0035308184
MPTYEQGHFIERALDSLLAQSFSDWEALIVDDGSGDCTAEAVAPRAMPAAA